MAKRVVIVGGGCAGVAAAWELSQPGLGNEVTLYQEGWRLGGKGASGRGVHGRIEEHGLHIWLGYYENAFRMLHEADAELQAAGIPSTPPCDAFESMPGIGVFTDSRSGMDRWIGTFPERPGEPGDGSPLPPLRDAASLAHVARLLAHLMQSLLPTESGTLASAVEDALRVLESAGLFRNEPFPSDANLLGRFVALRELLRPILQSLSALGAEARTFAELADIILATTIGYFQEQLVPGWYDRLNRMDFRDWLATQDCILPTSRSNPFLASLYNLAFAYEQGDPSRPRIAAGVALECALRTFLTYKRAPFWRINGGMGDRVFAPLYLALRARGVQVKFFHRLRAVQFAPVPQRDQSGRCLSPGAVEVLVFDEQVELAGDSYEPLISVHGQPCWPAEPLWDQLVSPPGPLPRLEHPDDNTAARQVTLHRSDFDHVILALGADSLPPVLGSISASDPVLRAALAAHHSIATQAMQLWFRPTPAELGWDGGPVAMTGLAPGLDTWADMSHLARFEAWPEQPGAIVYLCGTIPEPADPSEYPVLAAANEVRLLTSELRRPLPGTCDDTGFRADLLAGPNGDAIYRRLNTHGSARYAQSLPGTIAARISPLDPSFSNLTFAGDWTDCGLNVGCVEAAVCSGILAAAAVTGAIDAGRLVGHNYVRPWFTAPRTNSLDDATPPAESSSLESRAQEMSAAVDAELDRFDDALFAEAMQATAPLRHRVWATDSIPVIQSAIASDRCTTVRTGIPCHDDAELASFTAAWVSQYDGRQPVTPRRQGAELVLEIPPVEAQQNGVEHILVHASSGQAILLVELFPERA